MSEEQLLEEFLETGIVSDEDIKRLIRERKVFPCYFGSALKLFGVKELLEGFDYFTSKPLYPDEFGAKIFKITRDEQGNRLTHMKLTGGILKVKAVLTKEQEKVNQIRVYNGSKYETINEVFAGDICAVTGLTKTKPGDGLGIEEASSAPILTPVLNYQVILPIGCDPALMLPKFLQLEEEIPELHIVWEEETKSIQVEIMGEVQTEVLKSIVKERYGVDISFDSGSIVYKETIENMVEGIGHFEPLKHYAEVHLLMEPLPLGSGLQFDVNCSEDVLDRNWQRLVLTHLEEKEHRGVLTGAPITDMKITLVTGRAHQKHTEGGDFRQATYRAVRQGLKKAKSVLLEPYYSFRLEIPEAVLGRALMDLERMKGSFELKETKLGIAIITGQAPVVLIQNYQKEVTAYTKGYGKLNLNYFGYGRCHNEEEIITEKGYDSEADLLNPTSSVFCAHGSGFVVNWDEVEQYMHLESVMNPLLKGRLQNSVNETNIRTSDYWMDTEEIDHILERTYYSNRKDKSSVVRGRKSRRWEQNSSPITRTYKKSSAQEEYLLIDGYNVIFSNQELKELALEHMDAAAGKLMDIVCNYQGYRGCKVLLVFDAYRVQGHSTEIINYHNIQVVYTKEAETADQFIEKFAHENAQKYRITVATSDGVEQIIIRSKGCQLLSARDFWDEIGRVNKSNQESYEMNQKSGKSYLFDTVSEQTAKKIGEIRSGEELK